MNTNKFTFRRFASFFRWFAAVSMKHSLLILSVIAAVAIVAGLVSSWSHYDSDGRIYAIILFVASGVAGSMCLSSIDKQTVRQQFISIPATNFEKFLAVIALTTIRLMVVYGIVVAADGIWAQPPNCTTFLDKFTLFSYWVFNILAGMGIRKIPYLYGLLIGGGFSYSVIRSIKALLGNGETLGFATDSIGVIIFVSILIIGALVISYYCFKRIRLNTFFYQDVRYNEL
ncbi:MAG: hypothetical protein II956_06990 [Bacteroidales bacterium]|nr:hypothetical protein [Bacteroidales bacterium]